MQILNNGTSDCTKPEIVAGHLLSIRNIYLRQELRTISNQIQEKFEERLPALQLVSTVAYEQVFNRQPLSPPEELRREAVKYGLKYYQRNMKKLRSIFPKETNSMDNSDTPAATSAFGDGISSSSSDDISSDTISNSSSFKSLPETTSDQSTITNKLSKSKKKHSRTKSPKIVVHRASNNTLISNNTKDSSSTTDQQNLDKTHRSSSNKRKSRKKSKKHRLKDDH